jgi:hypothetical protein
MVIKKEKEEVDRKARRLKSREGHEGKKDTDKNNFLYWGSTKMKRGR